MFEPDVRSGGPHGPPLLFFVLPPVVGAYTAARAATRLPATTNSHRSSGRSRWRGTSWGRFRLRSWCRSCPIPQHRPPRPRGGRRSGHPWRGTMRHAHKRDHHPLRRPSDTRTPPGTRPALQHTGTYGSLPLSARPQFPPSPGIRSSPLRPPRTGGPRPRRSADRMCRWSPPAPPPCSPQCAHNRTGGPRRAAPRPER